MNCLSQEISPKDKSIKRPPSESCSTGPATVLEVVRAPVHNILFLDDEISMAPTYRRLGEFLPANYRVITVARADEALLLTSQNKFSVVLSDLMMGQMNGDQFLSLVAQHSPATGRIFVSASANRITMAKALMIAHRYFAKPFSPVALASAIQSLSESGTRPFASELKVLIGRLESLPLGAETYSRITRSLNSMSDFNLNELSQTIESDPALAAKVLQTANSAFFSSCQHISSITEAVQIIGLEVVRALAIGVRLFGSLCTSEVKQFVSVLWEHSFEVAVAAKKIAEQRSSDADFHSDAFLAGLFHDIGKVVFARARPAEYLQVQVKSGGDAQELCAAESVLFGATHAEAGAYLLHLWGIPELIVDAVRAHHSIAATDLPARPLAAAIYLAQTARP